MTSIVGWVGVDSRGPASVYLASDSRVSWLDREAWDSARKLFATRGTPDLFGYCGGAFAPALFLAQFASMIDVGAHARAADADARHDALFHHASAAVDALPSSRREPFGLVHFSRDGAGMGSSFRAWWTSWDPGGGWVDRPLVLPDHSALVLARGSGASSVEVSDLAWRKSDVGGTSRAVFSAFCEALQSGRDSRSGGAPQLVALYREGVGRTIGVVYRNSRFMLGAPVQDSTALLGVEWRNELFERCDPASLKRLHDAQPHARPRGLPGA